MTDALARTPQKSLIATIEKLDLTRAAEAAGALAAAVERGLITAPSAADKADISRTAGKAASLLIQRLKQRGLDAQHAVEIVRPLALAGVHGWWLTGVDIREAKETGHFGRRGPGRGKEHPAGCSFLRDIGPDNIVRRAQQIAAADWQDFLAVLSEPGTDIPSLRGAVSIWLGLKPDTPPFPPGKFGIVYADPPWEYDFSVSESRSIGAHYKPMSVEEISALPVPEKVEDDCVLFLWATNPKLLAALDIMTAWDFSYKTNMVWKKDKIGPGYYARQQHELLLIGTRGETRPPEEAARPPSVIEAARTSDHSEKPRIVYEIIESMYPGRKRIELFQRGEPRKGWVVWGNESNNHV